MKKILYCASTANHLRSFHIPYLQALTEAGRQVTAAASGTGEGLPPGVAFVDVPFTKSFFSLRNLRASAQLAALMRRERFDTVLVHTSLAAFFARLGVLLAGKRKTRVVNTVHGYLFGENSPQPRRGVLLAAEKLTAPLTDEILTMNAEDTRIAQKHRLCRGGVVQVGGMGVDASRFRPAAPEERAETRAALDIPPDAFVMLYAAEFSPRKNQRFLLECMCDLPGDMRLILPGDGELLTDCRRYAAGSGLAGRVLFPGYRPDTRLYRAAADVCVSSSLSEGLPFHVMEAMLCGLPCLLTDVKGHADLMAGGACGVCYPVGDRSAFRQAAEQLRDDPALRALLGENARLRAQDYRLEAVMPELMAHYL